MTVEEAICARLLELTSVTALVSTRIYLDKLPQGPTYPCIRVQVVDDIPQYHLRGQDGLPQARIQIDAFVQDTSGVDSYRQAAAVAETIDGELSGWVGFIGSPGFEVWNCQRSMRWRRYDPDELQVLTISQDYLVSYRNDA